jgi:hypothetical protein
MLQRWHGKFIMLPDLNTDNHKLDIRVSGKILSVAIGIGGCGQLVDFDGFLRGLDGRVGNSYDLVQAGETLD